MKVKALIKFKDVKGNKVREKGSIFDTTKERFKELNSTSWGVIVEEVPSKEATKNRKIIDISAKLTNERPKLKLAEDKIYEIDDRKNTILLLNQKMQGSDFEDLNAMDEMIKIVLGEGAAKDINEMNLPISSYQSIMIAIMAAMTGEDYEVAEARFRQQAGI